MGTAGRRTVQILMRHSSGALNNSYVRRQINLRPSADRRLCEKQSERAAIRLQSKRAPKPGVKEQSLQLPERARRGLLVNNEPLIPPDDGSTRAVLEWDADHPGQRAARALAAATSHGRLAVTVST
ncbi:unnamed protein product, partial [Iphiclides podalirius]